MQAMPESSDTLCDKLHELGQIAQAQQRQLTEQRETYMKTIDHLNALIVVLADQSKPMNAMKTKQALNAIKPQKANAMTVMKAMKATQALKAMKTQKAKATKVMKAMKA